MRSVKPVLGRNGSLRSNNALQFAICLSALLSFCLPAFSQGSFGRILGTVADQSGGVISGATITIIDTERGISRTLTTDDAGAYNAPNLTAGNYTVRGEAKGFKRIERQGVMFEVGHEIRVDLTVQPGEQNQTVTVTEAVPLVETTNATMGGTLENSDIIDLPLNGRDYQNLLGLRPGVMLQPGGGPWTQSANGVRPDESVWLIEGIINANFFDARPVINMPSPFTDGATILPVDAIQEFNLMENPKAEYGWKAGAIVNVGIKSGTNALHGDAYAFGRYQNWDARNYFNIASPAGCSAALLQSNGQCPQTDAQLKQFGAVVGGPIKKDKLFFFGGYEGLRSFIGFVGGISVPATLSVGDPSKSMVDAIRAVQIAGVPLSSVSLKLAGCTAGPAPACNGSLFPNSGTSNSFLSTFPTTNTSDNGVGKLDYHLNDKNSINGMFFYGHYNAIGEDHPFVQLQSTDSAPIRTMTITSSWVYTPNSNVVNELRFGYDRASFNFVNIDVATPANGVGYPINTGVTNPLAGGLPSITITGFGNGGTPVLGTAFNRPQYFSPNPYWDVQDSISVQKGKHAIKLGGEFAHLEADAQVFNNGRGRINFVGGGIGPLLPGSTSLEDFFAGTPGNSTTTAAVLLAGQPQSKLTAYNYALFVQDDWRATPRLILNLGMRYTYLTPLRDAFNNIGNFDPSSPTGIVQQGQNGFNSIWKPDSHDFEPRFGLAWDMMGNGTTVLRLGIGLIHELWNLETFEGQFGMQGDGSTAINAIPTAATISCSIPTLDPAISCPSFAGGTDGLGSVAFAPTQLCYDPFIPSGPARTPACIAGQQTVFPVAGAQCGDGLANPVQPSGHNPSPCDLMSVDPNIKLPYILNYNIGVTHAFGSNLSLEVEYVGNHGYRLLNFADINQAQLGSANCSNSLTVAQKADACGPFAAVDGGLASQESRPYYSKFPYLGYIYQATNRSYSNYNSLQVAVTKRVSHGLTFNVGYTYGHGLDNGSLNRFGLNPQNSNNLAAEYGSSDFDVRHRLTATVTYDLPGVKGFGQLLQGWEINSIVTFATAQPWQTFDPSDNFSGTGENADRWNIFGLPSDFPSGKSSFNDCTVNAPNTAFTFGNVTCTISSIYGGVPTPATQAQVTGCQSHSAPSSALGAGPSIAPAGAIGTPLATAGCYISVNGNSYITPPALGTFGDMGRNIFRDQGFKDWDVSIFKNFKFKERYEVQARWEVFNVLNHPIAANPSGASSFVNTGNSPGPGAVFGASLLTPDFAAGNPLIGSGSQRVMQVGLKLIF